MWEGRQEIDGREYSMEPRAYKNGRLQRRVGHCMLPYIRDQILELAKDSLLVAVL